MHNCFHGIQGLQRTGAHHQDSKNQEERRFRFEDCKDHSDDKSKATKEWSYQTASNAAYSRTSRD